jgi:hypothetical protein
VRQAGVPAPADPALAPVLPHQRLRGSSTRGRAAVPRSRDA